MLDDQIRAGRLDQRITLIIQNTDQDSAGGLSQDPEKAPKDIEMWAHISPMRGLELRESLRDVSELWVTITVRYYSGKLINETMQILHNSTGTIYEVKAVSHMETSRKKIELTCRVVK